MKGGGAAGAAGAAPGDYVYFKSVVPLHKISIGLKLWRYYDFGPKAVPPLVCIPGIAGTADVYYKQIMSLSMKVPTLSDECVPFFLMILVLLVISFESSYIL
ncbi:hypothetical protein GUJ93_ZPchr0012g22022 [Zizania palustris]|uniref:Uncharacterized protein n=1 Tax=Zizania palustris TaxID=103762 RepID=A0A8J5WRS7_ZIZPA|nr:hypothetical protein GUJ93_ZPchr0012g22022 [Zizania palustris]